MRQVNTVAGPVLADSIGLTLIHEHFLFGYPGWYGDLTMAPYDREACIRKGIDMAGSVKACGVKTIVDATPNEVGRDPLVLKEISAKTGINIVCATGYYYEKEGASIYYKVRRIYGDVVREIYEMFHKEASVGIGGTGIKAGVIKVASSRDSITRYEESFFRAAGRVSGELGTPIITHTSEGKQGPEQAKLLIESGADPERIMIGHMCGSTDIDYLKRTLDYGVSIGFDRFGIQGVVNTPTDSEREECLMKLIDLGYTGKIMLSHDYVNLWLGRGGIGETLVKSGKNMPPTHLFRNILPSLKKKGLTAAQIETMMVENPERLLAGR
jgi:phosphotriesterase-related protein